MSARPREAPRAAEAPRLAVLGTGVVGSAVLARWQRLRARGLALPDLDFACNTRQALVFPPATAGAADRRAAGGQAGAWLEAAPRVRLAPGQWPALVEDRLRPGDIVIDATASDAVAACHASWLARGLHVATANKLGAGAGLERAQAIVAAVQAHGTCYGDSATVGAGLPLLRSLRALVAGGDAIHSLEGVLSGSLAWLFHHYDGMRPFSGFVRQARQAGYTEPDPRIDLSGEDVRRKLLILARAAGLPLQAQGVQVESLVPAGLAALDLAQLDAGLEALDAPLHARFEHANREGARLRLVGRFAADGTASVGLRALPPDHPLCAGGGTDNKVAITSDRYAVQPLVIQGPGAGAEVTAAALLDDVLGIPKGMG